MIISRRPVNGRKFTPLAAAPLLTREVRYFSDGRELPFSLSIESTTHRFRVELSLEEAQQIARDLAELETRGQRPLFGHCRHGRPLIGGCAQCEAERQEAKS